MNVAVLKCVLVADLSVLGTQVSRCGTSGMGGLSTAPPQLCSDDLLSFPLCSPPPEWQFVSCRPGRCLPSRCSPTSTPAVLFSLIAAGERSGFQSQLESTLMGGRGQPGGLCFPVSVTVPYLGI